MYKNVLCLVLGLIIGIRLTDIWDFVRVVQQPNESATLSTASSSALSSDASDDYPSSDLAAPSGAVAAHVHAKSADLAAQLYNSTRVLCWVLTTPTFHFKRAVHLKNTWGRRCNRLIFMSSEANETLGSVALPVPEGRSHLWQKTREALRYIYERYYDEADWFLKADDDTYVIMENLRLFLHPFDPEAPVYFGCRFNPFVRQGYMSGGAGYVLSREALRRFNTDGYKDSRRCSSNRLSEDKELGICMQNIGVVAGDSRDELGRERFLPLAPKHLIPEDTSEWFYKYLFYKRDKKAFCCSDSAISFHYTKPHEFYILDYLLYTLRPFGLTADARRPSLPIRLSGPNMSELLDKWRHELSDNVYHD